MRDDYATFICPAVMAVRDGMFGMDVLPGAVLDLITLDPPPWREFRDDLGRTVRYDTFREFVEAKHPDGLGLKPAERLHGLLAKCDDTARRTEASRAVRAALKGKPGRPRIGEEMDGKCPSNSGGRETDYTIQRLHDQAPELYDEVTAGRMSVHSAAVKAGFRRPTATVRLDNPAKAVSVLLKHYTRQQLLDALEATN